MTPEVTSLVITPNHAGHILAEIGNKWGHRPNTIEQLAAVDAYAHCEPDDHTTLTTLTNLWPEYAWCIDTAANEPDGIQQLETIVRTCTAIEVEVQS